MEKRVVFRSAWLPYLLLAPQIAITMALLVQMISAPAMAGPTMRLALNEAAPSAIADDK